MFWRLLWEVCFFGVFQKCLFPNSSNIWDQATSFGVAGSEWKVKWDQFHFVWLFVVCELTSLTSVLEGSHPHHTDCCCSWHWVKFMDRSLHLATSNAKKSLLLFVDRVHAFSVSWLSMKSRWHFRLSQCQSLSIWKTELPHRWVEVTWVPVLGHLSMAYLKISPVHPGPAWRLSPLAGLGVHTVLSSAHSSQSQGK